MRKEKENASRWEGRIVLILDRRVVLVLDARRLGGHNRGLSLIASTGAVLIAPSSSSASTRAKSSSSASPVHAVRQSSSS